MTKSRTLTLFLASSLALTNFVQTSYAHDEQSPTDLWVESLEKKVQRHMGYPIRATNAREEGVVLLRVQLNDAGQVASSQILQSSGSEVLDQAGLKLAHKLKNLPTPPSVAGEQINAFHLQLNYTLTPPGRRLSPRDEYLRKYSKAKQANSGIDNSTNDKVAIIFERNK